MTENAFHIRRRIPDKIRQIDRLLELDPEFANLCEDLDACVNALQHWRKSKEPEAEIRVREYRKLILELEKEIIQALGAVNLS